MLHAIEPQDSAPNQETTDIELLSFRVGEHEYSVDIMSVREIRGWTKTTSLPHSPDYVRGVINLRGTVLPVIDLNLIVVNGAWFLFGINDDFVTNDRNKDVIQAVRVDAL